MGSDEAPGMMGRIGESCTLRLGLESIWKGTGADAASLLSHNGSRPGVFVDPVEALRYE
jgi:hypothetical protein